MNRYLLLLLIWPLLLGSLLAQSSPNLIYIMVDDLGWKDVGFMGSQYYQTPNLDQLASRSLVFDHGYAGAANCAPSRAMLMSGQHPMRHGIYTVAHSDRGQSQDRALIPTKNTLVLEDSMLTFAEVLQEAGYRTGIFGKWHLGKDPATQGFDVVKAGTGRRNTHFAPFDLPGIEEEAGEYLTDRLAEEAVQFMENRKEQPFFLYLPFFSIHTKLVGKPGTVDKYQGLPPVDGQGNNAEYAAMVEHVDDAVGRVMAALARLGLQENTLVVFCSDNGGIAYLSRQWPLRAGKGSYYEGGIRVPMLFHWPGKVPAGERTDVPITFIDMFPTLTNLLGVEVPENKALDGTDLSATILGEKTVAETQNRALFWHFPIYLEKYNGVGDDSRDALFRTRPGTVMRKGRWKLHEYFEDGGLELYDLAADPGERINLATLLPEESAQLHAEMKAWREAHGAPVPTERNPEYEGK
ncbi:MAG: sulfatase [Bacteroidota bacterium]